MTDQGFESQNKSRVHTHQGIYRTIFLINFITHIYFITDCLCLCFVTKHRDFPFKGKRRNFIAKELHHKDIQFSPSNFPCHVSKNGTQPKELQSESLNSFRLNKKTELIEGQGLSDVRFTYSNASVQTQIILDRRMSFEFSRLAKENIGQLATEYLDFEKQTYRRARRSALKENLKLKIAFQLEKPISDPDEDASKRKLVSQLAKAMRIPIASIKDLTIHKDTDVSFTLSSFNDENNVMDDQSIIEAADSLKAKIKSRQLQLTDLNDQMLLASGNTYASLDDSMDYSLGILIILCITLLVLTVLIATIVYIARRTSHIPRASNGRNEAYRDINFGRDSSQSIGKYSYDSGLWLGPGPEPSPIVPDAPYYRPPTVDQIASTPRPVTAVRTRLKRNWNVDERALSTIPDDQRSNKSPWKNHRR